MTLTQDMQPHPRGRTLARYALASIAAALVTIGLKMLAWYLTGSVGMLSDALESVVNLTAAVFALVALHVAAWPADDNHAFGHAKVEYFAAGLEGMLILVAAVVIAWTAAVRLIEPQPVESVGIGLAISIAASLVNLGVGTWLLRVGRRYRSITLEADGRHLLTDVWTSAGVVAGVAAVAVTDVYRIDPIIALVVAANIVVTGLQLIRRSLSGLMDEALTPDRMVAVLEVLERVRADGNDYHALRTRTSGHRAFLSVHVLVPGSWTVQEGHDYVEELEQQLCRLDPGFNVVTHLEPIEDSASFTDAGIVG